MRAAAAVLALLLLAGCAAAPAGPATTSGPPAVGDPEDFSIPAPDLRTGYGWVLRMSVKGQATAGPFTVPIDIQGTVGTALLSDGFRYGAHPAMVGMAFEGLPDATSLSGMSPVAAIVLDTVDMRDLAVEDLQFLRDCQRDIATCPRDLEPLLGAGASHSFGSMLFPLEPGSAWDSTAAPEGFTGTLHVRVMERGTANVMGRDVATVRLNLTGSYRIEAQEDGARATGTMELTGTGDYSPELMAWVSQRIHEVDHMRVTSEGRTIDVEAKATTTATLVAATLEDQASLDAVQLYDAFGLGGRDILIEAKRSGPGRLDVTLRPVETPDTGIAWKVLSPDGALVEEGRDLEFTVALGPGISTIDVEARHEGALLVSTSAELSPEGIVEPDPVAPVVAKETVACDPFVITLPGGIAQGSCPTVGVALGEGYTRIEAMAMANSTFPGMAGTLEILDAGGVVQASATMAAVGNVTFAPQGRLEPGEWQARFRPETALQATVHFQVVAT